MSGPPDGDQEHEPPSHPDYRFTLANERTFLAWVRTALGLLAGAVAVSELVSPFRVNGARTGIAVACMVLALVLAAGAYPRWRAVERSMRKDAPLPQAWLIPVLAGGSVLLVVIAAALIVR